MLGRGAAALEACSTKVRPWTATSAWRADASATRDALSAISLIAWPVSDRRTFIVEHMSWTSKVEAPNVWSVSCILLRTVAEEVGDVAARAGLAHHLRFTPIDANVS